MSNETETGPGYDEYGWIPWVDYNPCIIPVDELIVYRFILVALFGCTCAGISVLENCFAFYALISRRKYRKSHFLYLIFLAVFDVFVSLSYILLFGVNVVIEYVGKYDANDTMMIDWDPWAPPDPIIYALSKAWWNYFWLVYGLSQVSLTATGYMIVVATWERFLVTAKSAYLSRVRKSRVWICGIAFALGFVIKFTSFFEFSLAKNSNCTGLNEYMPGTTQVRQTFAYHVYSIYIRNIIAVILPFLCLALLNFMIVSILRRQNPGQVAQSEHKQRIKAATRMLVCVVSCYLLANVLNVFVTVWEVIDFDSLRNDYRSLYTYAADTVSLLTIIMCALRLPIYLFFNPEMRSAMRAVFSCGFLERGVNRFSNRRGPMLNGASHNNDESTDVREMSFLRGEWSKWHTEFSPLVVKMAKGQHKHVCAKKSDDTLEEEKSFSDPDCYNV